MRIDQRLTGKLGQIDTETGDCRNAAGAREHRDMAGRTAGRQHECPTARPINAEETRRREVDCSHNGSGWYRSLDRGSRQMREHAVAEVIKVGSARSEIFIIGSLITGDFLLHRLE